MKMIFLLMCLYFVTVEGVVYHRFFGDKLNDTQIKEFTSKNITGSCTIDLRPCTAHEGSRIDGTCNNYKHPTRGSAIAPYLRIHKPEFARNTGIRVATDGEPLPSARLVRTTLQPTGRVVDRNFNMAAVHLFGFVAADMTALNGIMDYLRDRPYCCQPEGRADPRCIPISVPEDDPYLRMTDIRCLNFSRAQTFQDIGCIPKTLPPEQINFQTPLLDLSTVYGVDEAALSLVREGKDGLLKMETRKGRYVPLGDVSNDVCFRNRPNETVCYRFGFPLIGNFDLRLATFTIFFMREHNRIAKALAEINPCWKDDRLFKVARQINIATASNIYMYELLPLFLGYKNMLDYGLMSDRLQHVPAYDEDSEPNLYAEYAIGTRYFHTFVDGRIKNYDKHYRETSELSISDTLFRLDLIEQNKTFEEMNRGTFYQKSAGIDDIQDPELSEKFYGEIHRANDLLAIDIQRGRDMGVAGYNEYRALCGFPRAKKFDDFLDTMDVSKVDALKKLYTEVDDVDFLAGVVSENFIEDGFVGPTLFCVMAKQMQLMRYGDRFWFERGDQFHSFTIPQLREVRETTMARFACDNADGIEHIQPRALLNVAVGNEHVPCDQIKGIDFTKWQDSSCHTSSTKNDIDPFFNFLK